MTLTREMVEDAIGDLEGWAHQCHGASIALVKSGLLGRECRVARGSCRGVPGQHSWVVRGSKPEDCFNPRTVIIDVTLWSYDPDHPHVWIGTMENGLHRPHGYGPPLIQLGCPESGGGAEIALNWIPGSPTPIAAHWLSMFREGADGPLDQRFWMGLANTTVVGWPAEEFIRAMANTPAIQHLIPIDRLGMLTNENPGGLYLPEEAS